MERFTSELLLSRKTMIGMGQKKLSKSFTAFFDSEKSSGILLILCTVVSLVLANSIWGVHYVSIWQARLGGLSVEHWVNDALIAIFFLRIGLELERELYNGELSNF
jgi:Na+:H+ antiporter, NhaA family